MINKNPRCTTSLADKYTCKVSWPLAIWAHDTTILCSFCFPWKERDKKGVRFYLIIYIPIKFHDPMCNTRQKLLDRWLTDQSRCKYNPNLGPKMCIWNSYQVFKKNMNKFKLNEKSFRLGQKIDLSTKCLLFYTYSHLPKTTWPGLNIIE